MNSTKRIIQGYLYSQSLAYIVAGFYLVTFRANGIAVFEYLGYIILAVFLLVIFSLFISITTTIIFINCSKLKNLNWGKRYIFIHLKRRVAITLDYVVSPILPILTIAALVTNIVKEISDTNIGFNVIFIITVGLLLFLLVQLLDIFKANLKIGFICLLLIGILIFVKLLFPTVFLITFVLVIFIAFLISAYAYNKRGRTRKKHNLSLYQIPRILLLGAIVFLVAGIIANVSGSSLNLEKFLVPSLCMLCIMTSFLLKLPGLNDISPRIMQIYFKLTIVSLLSGTLYAIYVISQAQETGKTSIWLVVGSFIICFFIAFSNEIMFYLKKLHLKTTSIDSN